MEADDTSVRANDTIRGEKDGSNNVDVAEIIVKNMDKRELRAKSARELVQNQERLVDMLQSMKTDLSKMDREASRIKEDIVRSKQYHNVVVKMKQPHHLKYLPEGYNLPHSMPKVIYPRYRNIDRELSMRYLNQLSTYRPNLLNGSDSRRSSISGQHSSVSNDDYGNRMASSARSSRRSSNASGRSSSSPYSGFSGTESEMESTRTGSSSDISNDSYCSFEEAGSSTESTQPADFPKCSNSQQLVNRRSSYFYTARVETPPHAHSDEVEL